VALNIAEIATTLSRSDAYPVPPMNLRLFHRIVIVSAALLGYTISAHAL
jgi:hypothetical protein